MANMLDYLDWYGDFDFGTVPFNEVDNLILSQLSYLELADAVPPVSATPETVTVRDAWGRFRALHPSDEGINLGPLISPLTVSVFEKMAAGGRFGDTLLCEYASRLDTGAHEQFGALTALVPEGSPTSRTAGRMTRWSAGARTAR